MAQERSRRFLMNELKKLKEQFYSKLSFVKAQARGKKHSESVDDPAQSFDIRKDVSIEQLLKKEIDHLFVMS